MYYNAGLIKVATQAADVIIELPKWVNRSPAEYTSYENCEIAKIEDSPARSKSHYRLTVRVMNTEAPFRLMRHETVSGPHYSHDREHFVVGPYTIGETGGVVHG